MLQSRSQHNRFLRRWLLSVVVAFLVAGVALYASWNGTQDPAITLSQDTERTPSTLPDHDDHSSKPADEEPFTESVEHLPRTIGLERRIEIRVTADRVTIGSTEDEIANGSAECKISVDEDTTPDMMVDQIELGIDRIVESWGSPPSSFYWLPTLRYFVHPAGMEAYERIRGAVERKLDVTSSTIVAGSDDGPPH
jgi:hypothetical protein